VYLVCRGDEHWCGIAFLGSADQSRESLGFELFTACICMGEYTRSAALLLPITVIFAAAAILAGAMRLLLLWASGRSFFCYDFDKNGR